MNQLHDQFPVQRLAEVLSVSRASVYRSAEPGPRAQENAVLTQAIDRVYQEHQQRYGSPRICIQLRAEGMTCGENRVARLMREAGLYAITPNRKTPRTTDSSHYESWCRTILSCCKSTLSTSLDAVYDPYGALFSLIY